MTSFWLMIASAATILISSSHNSCALAFAPNPRIATSISGRSSVSSTPSVLRAAEEGSSKTSVVNQVTGEELEMMMQEWEQPLVVDAYATWCGPCLLMAPEFEAAAKELEGKVRFAKLDTDKEETMAARLNIMGLPTLLFLDKYNAAAGAPPTVDGKEAANAVLKGRLEGALRKDMIVKLCNYYFFDGPVPDGMAA